MKIRIGFVSNSSSTSFCIYGLEYDKESIIKRAFKDDEELEELEDYYNFIEAMYQKAESVDVDCYHPFDDDTGYIGIEWTTIGDNETGKQFKERVFNKLIKIIPDLKQEELRALSQSWREG